MVVTYSNLFSESQTQLKNFLKTNLTDPKSRYKKDFVLSQKVIYPSAVDFVGYPYVVVESTELGEPEYSNDRTVAFVDTENVIGVYSSDLAYRDSVSNQIFQLLNDRSNRDTLYAQGLRLVRITRLVDEEILEGKRIFVARFTVMAKERMEVTA